MSDRIYVATRKGLFIVERRAERDWRIAVTSFIGDPVTMVLEDPRDGVIYVALNLGHFGVKMHRSGDRGATWHECAAPSFPVQAEAADTAKKGPSVQQVWSLSAGGPDQPGQLWAGTIPGGLFRSTDGAESWQLVESLWNRPDRAHWFGGGYDDPGIHSVLVDPRNSQHLLVGISCGGVWASENGGETWGCKGSGMYAEYMPPDRRDDPNIQDPHLVVRCASAPDALWVQHHNGIFRSLDGATTWTDIPAAVPSKFGFAVAVHPSDPETAWFAPAVKDECRVPVDGKVVVSRTRDGGRSFEVLREGLPQGHAYDLIFRHALDVDYRGIRLCMGSTTGSLWISENGGDVWTCVSANLPPVYMVRFAAA